MFDFTHYGKWKDNERSFKAEKGHHDENSWVQLRKDKGQVVSATVSGFVFISSTSRNTGDHQINLSIYFSRHKGEVEENASDESFFLFLQSEREVKKWNIKASFISHWSKVIIMKFCWIIQRVILSMKKKNLQLGGFSNHSLEGFSRQTLVIRMEAV